MHPSSPQLADDAYPELCRQLFVWLIQGVPRRGHRRRLLVAPRRNQPARDERAAIGVPVGAGAICHICADCRSKNSKPTELRETNVGRRTAAEKARDLLWRDVPSRRR
jgi:hypothetical protein